MDPVKSTNELMHELEGDIPFGQVAEENSDAFLGNYASDTRGVCPFCGASLREGASYCVSCMRPLQERRIIPMKKRTGKPVRQLWTALGIFVLLAALAAVFFTTVLPLLRKKSAQELPSAAEFRVLAAGASEEEWQKIWSQEAFTLQKQEGGFSVYEAVTPVSKEPLRAAFSEDGKCLLFALTDVTADDSADAMKLLKTAFSAVYRYFPENLEEILSDEAGFTVKDRPDEGLSELLQVFGIAFSGNTEIRESLPIYADRFAKIPAAHVYKTVSDGRLSLFVRFDSEGQ